MNMHCSPGKLQNGKIYSNVYVFSVKNSNETSKGHGYQGKIVVVYL